MKNGKVVKAEKKRYGKNKLRRQVGSLGKNSKESYERKGERRKKMLVLLPEGNKIKRGIFFKGVRGNGWEEKGKLENEIKEVKGKSCF